MSIIATAAVDFTIELSKKIAIAVSLDWVKKKGNDFLGADKTAFEKELENTIYDTIRDYDLRFPTTDEPGRIAFYKSEILIQNLLTIRLLGKDQPDFKELKDVLHKANNIISPTQSEVIAFLEIFEHKCKGNSVLIKHQFIDNYKEAIFSTLEIVSSIQTSLSKAITEMKGTLQNEYWSQLEEIHENILAFKPKTALERLKTLEKRIRQNSLNTPQVEAKLLFLEGTCILESEKNKTGAELIVKAYLKYPDNSILGDVAIAYLNLGDERKVAEYCEKILGEDPFNGTAWFLKLILANENYLKVLEDTSVVVKNKRGYRINVIHHLRLFKNLDYYQIEQLGFKLPDKIDDTFNHSNITLWEKIVFVKISNYFNSVREFTYDEKGKLGGFQKNGLEEILEILVKFFDVIKTSEISYGYSYLKFSYFFIRHLLDDNSFDKDEFQEIHLKLKENGFLFDLQYATYLVDIGQLENALELLSKSIYKDDEGIIVHRIIYSKIAGQNEEVNNLIKIYLNQIDVIGFEKIFNLNSFFSHLFSDKELLKNEYEKVLSEKIFQSEEIKSLFRITTCVNFFADKIDPNGTEAELVGLSEFFKEERSIVYYISTLLFSLRAYEKCASILEPLLERGKQTNINLLYSKSTYNLKTNLPSLLGFLKEIRVSNDINLYDFLALENNLRQSIDDIEEIIDIAWRGVKQYSHVEHFHQNLLSALERKGVKSEFETYSQKYLRLSFSDENIGLWVSSILGRNGSQTEAATLLFDLASKPSNSLARTTYVTSLNFPEGFLIDYFDVQQGSHVKLTDGHGVKLLTVDKNDKYGLIGKGLGDTVIIKDKVGFGIKTFRISRVMNKELFLLETILEEAKNENSELGLKSFDFTGDDGKFDVKAFEKFIVENSDESEHINRIREECIKSYSNGEKTFTDICRQVFGDDFLECYSYLINQQFFALPAIHNANLSLPHTEKYVLDFTSLILFSDLKIKYGINIDKRFIVGVTMVSLIKSKLLELKASPAPKMKIVVIEGKIAPVPYPDDYQEKQIQRYDTLVKFVEEHCEETVIEEKLDFLPILEKEGKSGEPYFHYLMDNLLFCTNRGYTLISNDTIFSNSFKGLNPKQISPELFLLRYFKMKYRKEIVEYFVQNHYIGIIIDKDILLSEYNKKIKGQENLFHICLSNLKTRWNLSPSNISIGIKFIKEISLLNFISPTEKSLVSQTIFLNVLDGFTQKELVINYIVLLIENEFKLLGDTLNVVKADFFTALKTKN